MTNSWEQDFRAELARANQPISPGDRIIVDDMHHRYRAGPEKDADAWYALHIVSQGNGNGEAVVAGAYGHWARLDPVSWCSKQKSSLTKEEWRELAQSQKDIAKRRVQEEQRAHEAARAKVADWFARFPKADSHLYTVLKQVGIHGDVRLFADEMYQDWLCIPLRDIAGKVWSAQVISDSGDKKFASGGKIKGCYFELSSPANNARPIVICEGYATGASIYEATGWAVICAMNCGNLDQVARDFRSLYPDREIIFAADNDQFTDGNPGLTKAMAAAKAVKGRVCFPEFPPGTTSPDNKLTDFNDLQSVSPSAVRSQLFSVFPNLQVIESKRFDPSARPPAVRILYTLQDKIVATPGNLGTITAAIKVGKSAVMGAAISSAICQDPDGQYDFLTFKGFNPNQFAVIHFDTEQSPDDYWFTVNRMLTRSGISEPPKNLFSYCFTGLTSKQIWECVQQVYIIAANQCGGIHSVFIDGIGDLVADVNDPEECNALVCALHDLSIRYDCHTMSAIHFNPGTEKSRGHLGSQIERKSETNLALDKSDGEITRIWSTRNRRAGIPKTEGPCFRYDPERGMHVSCDPPSTNKGGRPNEAVEIASSNLFDFIQECPPGGEYQEKIAERMEAYLSAARRDLSRATCKRIIKLMVENGKLLKENGRYFPGPNR